MPASAYTYTSVLNTALAGANLTENFQNMFLLLHAFHKAIPGVSVVASSDGVTADASDNISVIADVVSASAGARTWVVYSMPGGWYKCLECNDNASPPRDVSHYGADANGYVLGSPVTTAKPTATNVSNEWSHINVIHIPDTSFNPFTVHYTTASNGSGWFCVSKNGTAVGELALMIPRTPGADTATLDYAHYLYYSASGAFDAANVTSDNNWRGHHTNNSRNHTLAITSPAGTMALVTGGLIHSTSEPVKCPVMVHVNSASQSRVYGTIPDLRLGGSQMGSNLIEADDEALQRYITIDSTWLMAQASQIPAGPSPLTL